MTEIAQLTLWDVDDLFDYWQDHPPVHVLVAAYLLGTGKRPAWRQDTGVKAKRFEELARTVTGVGGRIHKRLPEIYRSVKSS